jgi:sodium-coupled neutral amino acid transporter 7/8
MFELLVALRDPGSKVGATLTLAIATVGCGVLALPVAFANAGILLAMTCLICVAMLTVFSCRSIAQAVEKLDLHCYEELSRELLGPSFELAVRGILVFYNLAACVGYVVIISDLFEPLEDNVRAVFPILATSKHTMVAFWFCIMLPMSMVRNISSLRFTSLFAICVAVYLALAIVYRYFVPFHDDGSELSMSSVLNLMSYHSLTTHKHVNPLPRQHQPVVANITPRSVQQEPAAAQIFADFHTAWFAAWNGAATLLSIPILMFSFDCESLVFQIFNSLNKRSVETMTQVATASTVLVSSLYTIIGVFGCLANGPRTTDNILASYNPKADPVFAIAYVFYSVPAVMAYTLTLFPVRDALFNALFNYSVGGHGSEDRISPAMFRLTSLLLSCLCVVTATVTPGIVSVFALLGGLCSSTLCLTYPAAFRIALHARGLLPAEPWEKRFMYVQVCIGILGAIFGTFIGVVKFFALDY